MNDNRICLCKELEKKFTIFRWLLLIIVAPATLKLSEYKENIAVFIIIISLALLYNAFITIAAYSKTNHFSQILKLTLYFDIPFVSLMLIARGGLRSDIYFVYFLLISYDSAKFGFYGTISSLIQSLIYFSIASFFFTSPQYFTLDRYLIRTIYLITLTFVMYEVNNQIDESRNKEKVARDQACRDPLTNLPNRLLLSEHFEILKQSFEETGRPFAIVLLDIDNFKSVNDSKGHTFGDDVLINLADIMKKSISPDDFACRFGGEEFVIFFADSNKQNAYIKANKIREDISSCNFFGKSITVSIGINIYQECYSRIENISFADEAMYAAKNAGKNQIAIYQDIDFTHFDEHIEG